MMKIGHRGAAGIEPENTLRAVQAALDCGMDAVEIDVRRTKDNQIAVIHDKSVDRTTDGKGLVNELTLAELKELDAGNGEKIPTLQEVIDAVQGKCKLVIELKEPTTEVAVAEVIEKNSMEQECWVISFHHPIVKMIKAYSNGLHTGVLFVGEPVNVVDIAKAANSEAAFSSHRFTSQKMVSRLHNAGLKVFVWNCDTREDIERMNDLGVDGISTNRPDIMQKVMGDG